VPVTVHVDEVHSDVAAAPATPGQHADAPVAAPWEAEERWREERSRMAWLAGRVCAADFDD
jgi:hypothetical protein